MTKCPWKEISEFQSPAEFADFKNWIDEQVFLNNAVRVDVKERYSGATMRGEWWFQHRVSGEVWRLVEPDPPFYGLFEPVAKHL